MNEKLEVLYEDNHLLVVFKPAGLLSQGDATGDVSILDVARAYLKKQYDKPGNVYVTTIHRLDRPVSGVLVLARTSKAASRLGEQFRDRTVHKLYRAVVEGKPSPPAGMLEHRLTKDRDRRVVSVAEDDEAGDEARLEYRLLESRQELSLLEIRLHTGRSHQIRVQLADSGWPIVADSKYGSQRRLPDRKIALQAHQIEIRHPTRDAQLTFTLPERLRLTLDDVLRLARPR